jgi:3-hydroxyisobutyrate dehydrogenase
MTTPATADKPRVGFVGLGVMGRPMAANLVRAGYPCTVYDINPSAVEALASLGARPAETAADAAQVSDIFITMVVNDAQMRAILFEPGNAAEVLPHGAIVIGMSTMSRAFVQETAARLEQRGVAYLDAPVSGGEVGATAGQLSIMAGGSDEVLVRCRAVLDVLGSNVYHVGTSAGDGQAVKMINQLMVTVHNAVAAEALAFGAQLGLDQARLLDIIGHSAGNSWIFSNRGPRMVERQFSPPKSALHILVKDLGFVIEAANRIGYPLVLGSAAHQLYKMAAAQGLSNLDDSILIVLAVRLAGLERDEATL